MFIIIHRSRYNTQLCISIRVNRDVVLALGVGIRSFRFRALVRNALPEIHGDLGYWVLDD